MSWDTLFSLQGHGPYILGAYGVTLALMGWEVLVLWRRGRRTARRQDPGAASGRRSRP